MQDGPAVYRPTDTQARLTEVVSGRGTYPDRRFPKTITVDDAQEQTGKTVCVRIVNKNAEPTGNASKL